MADDMADECIICRGPFKDAYFCSDGWSYCRECIIRWTAPSGIPWKSPVTNKLVYTPPLLARNERLRCLTIQALHTQLTESIAAKRVVETMRICGDLGSAITDTERVDALNCLTNNTVETLGVDEFWAAIGIAHRDSSQLLSVIVESGGVIWDALKEDLTSYRRPLVRVGVLEEMTRCVCEIGLSEFALPLLAHLCRRSSYCDAITIPPQQPKSRFEGRYERCTSSTEDTGLVFVSPRTASQLFIPSDGSPASVQTTSGERFVFPANKSTLPLLMDWQERRGDATAVFPDYNPYEDDTATEWTCPFDFSVFEQPLPYLPTATRYMPFVQREVCHSQLHAELLETLMSVISTFVDQPNEPKRRRRRQ